MLVYLCDDSESDILRLVHYLNGYAKQRQMNFELRIFSSGEELLAAFAQADPAPELVFLDIFMAELSGMAAARQLRQKGYKGGIIFTTSSSGHAMDSYEVNALYYLQKPYDRQHFENAMARCGALLQKARPHFTFQQRKKEMSVPYEDIIFFETGKSHTVTLHTVTGIYSLPCALTQVAECLKDAGCFLCVGRSFLINVRHVAGQIGSDLTMSDGSIVQIPLRRQREILEAVTGHGLKY